MHTATLTDIPFSSARAAYEASSHDPERAAHMVQEDWLRGMNNDYQSLLKHADTPGKVAVLDDQFEIYRQGYRRRYLLKLSAQSRTMSSFVTGPSNFPTRRNQKRLNTESKRSEEAENYRNNMMTRIKRMLLPEKFIKTTDANAGEMILSKLEKLEMKQILMVAANKCIRRHKNQDTAVPELIDMGLSEKAARFLLEPDCGRVGFAPWQLTNNSSEIRRLKGRQVDVRKC